MNLLMSDIKLPGDLPDLQDNCYIDLTKLKISNCIGCFGCWVKTPGKCVIRDDAIKVYPVIAKSKKLIYVSRVRYGGYDIIMKTMLERAIPIQQAFMRVYNGEIHHIQRNVEPKDAVIIAYGAKDAAEKKLFEKMVSRNANNMVFNSWRVVFTDAQNVHTAIRREVLKWQGC